MNDVSNKHRKSAFAVIFLFFMLSLPVLLFSQNWEFVWALPSGGTDIDKAYDITVDSLSNVIITGQFFGTAVFDTAILLSSGDSDIFIAKYDRGGNFLWAKKAGGTAEDFGSAIDTDRDGNIIITGYFNGNIDFDTISLSSDGETDILSQNIALQEILSGPNEPVEPVTIAEKAWPATIQTIYSNRQI